VYEKKLIPDKFSSSFSSYKGWPTLHSSWDPLLALFLFGVIICMYTKCDFGFHVCLSVTIMLLIFVPPQLNSYANQRDEFDHCVHHFMTEREQYDSLTVDGYTLRTKFTYENGELYMDGPIAIRKYGWLVFYGTINNRTLTK